MTKDQIIQIMKEWYMPQYFDIEMYDYTKMTDNEIYQTYLDELENYGDELTIEFEKHIK